MYLFICECGIKAKVVAFPVVCACGKRSIAPPYGQSQPIPQEIIEKQIPESLPKEIQEWLK